MTRRLWRTVGLALAAAALSSLAAAECIVVFHADPVVRLKHSKYVYLAQVLANEKRDGGELTTVKVVRSWKGDKKQYQWLGARPKVGEYYLVFGDSDPEVFPYECGNSPLALSTVHREITLLNRYRGYPRLVLPSPKPSRGTE